LNTPAVRFSNVHPDSNAIALAFNSISFIAILVLTADFFPKKGVFAGSIPPLVTNVEENPKFPPFTGTK
jgi:hypothetical protein